MRLLSFNVNSINAYLSKNVSDQFLSYNPDIIGIEEIKLSETTHDNFPLKLDDYETYWTVSKVKKGYAGTAVLSKIKPINVTYGIEGKYDDEGRVITVEYENFYLVELYVPNSGENLEKGAKPKRLPYRLVFEQDLREYLTSLKAKKSVIVTGDLNVAHNEIDLKHPETNHLSSGFTDEERDAFSQLLNLGFIDTFRYLYPDTVKYSYWSYRFKAREKDAGWRIDYFLVSEDLKDKIKDSYILNDCFGSDHCPVMLDVDL